MRVAACRDKGRGRYPASTHAKGVPRRGLHGYGQLTHQLLSSTPRRLIIGLFSRSLIGSRDTYEEHPQQ